MTSKQFNIGSSGNADGLNIADIILKLSESQKPLVRLMMRNSRGVTLAEATESSGREESVTRTMLNDLVQRGYVEELTQAGEPLYRIRLARKEGTDLAENLVQSLAPGSSLTLIPNPSGDYAIRPGEIFVLSVTVSNKGNQSALIDVSIDEGGAPTLVGWCGGNNRERLALGSKSNSEVVFEFLVPPDAMPGTYDYLIVVDAPQHYPEEPPVRHQGRLQVLPPVQGSQGVNDPTFSISPATSSRSPALLKPGELLQVVVEVHNRSDRVDRFRLTCPDLEDSWYSVRYPEGLEVLGLITGGSGLALNPGARGQIILLFNPPPNTYAGSYVPTTRLFSANNPDLMLLDVVYVELISLYLLNTELRTILGKVRRKPGIFEVRLSNAGNTRRQMLLYAHSADEEELCTYKFSGAGAIQPVQNDSRTSSIDGVGERLQTLMETGSERRDREAFKIEILPGGLISIELLVQPTKWWRRPLYGGGLLINFYVELENIKQDNRPLPPPPDPPRGTLLWEPRPWWQLLLVVLLTLGSIAALIFLIWWFFFRPPTPPKILEFTSEQTSYEEADGDFIRLKWQIQEPRQLEAIKITSQSPDSTVFSEPRLYNFSKGVPNELKEFCVIKNIERVLICNNVRTDARKAGDYVFELQTFSKRSKNVASSSVKTQNIKVSPLPQPKVVEFFSTQPVYEEAIPSGIATLNAAVARKAPLITNPDLNNTIRLNWKVTNPDQIKELAIVGRSPDGTVNSQLKRYSFSAGIPRELQNLCALKEALICQNIPTNAGKAGDYVFEITVIPKKGQGEAASAKKTDTIKIKALQLQPKIVYFKINNKEALPKYVVPLNKSIIYNLNVSWKVEGGKDMKVEMLPAPGTVQPVGSINYPLSQKPIQETITLKVTTAAGQQIERSVTIDIVEPVKADLPSSSPTSRSTPPSLSSAPPILPLPRSPFIPTTSPGAQSPTTGGTPAPAGGVQSPAAGGTPSPAASGTPSPANPNAPSLADPGLLSPAELPPRSN